MSSTVEEEETSVPTSVPRPSAREWQEEDELLGDYPALSLEDLGQIVDEYNEARARLGSASATTATHAMYNAIGEFMEYTYAIIEEWAEGESTGGSL